MMTAYRAWLYRQGGLSVSEQAPQGSRLGEGRPTSRTDWDFMDVDSAVGNHSQGWPERLEEQGEPHEMFYEVCSGGTPSSYAQCYT